MPIGSSSVPGLINQPARAKAGTDVPAPNALLTERGDLLIGSDGQVLTADSTNPQGVTWGTPGGNLLTTKGDLYGYAAAPSRVPVGSPSQVLTADPTAALGVSWQNPNSPVFPYWTDLFGADDLSIYPNSGDSWMNAYPAAFTISGGLLGIAPAQPGGPRLLLIPSYNLGKPRVDIQVAYAGEWGAGAPLTIALLWQDGNNNIYCRQDGAQMNITKRVNSIETIIANSAAVIANGGSAYYSAAINGETIRFRRWNADPTIMPPVPANFDVTAAIPSEFLNRSGLCGVGTYIDGSGGAGSRATKLDNFRVGVA